MDTKSKNIADTFKIIRIDPITIMEKYVKLSDKTSYGSIEVIETDFYTSGYDNIYTYMKDKFYTFTGEIPFLMDDEYCYDLLLSENKVFCYPSHDGYDFHASLSKGIHYKSLNNFCENLSKIDNVNHMVSAMIHPVEYFDTKVMEFCIGSCYLLRKSRNTKEYVSCDSVEQFIKEYNNQSDRRRHPTQIIKDKHNNYHLRSVSYIENFIVHDILKIKT